jgi:hypothetical protein
VNLIIFINYVKISASLFQKSKKMARKWDILEAATMGGLDIHSSMMCCIITKPLSPFN